MRTRINTTFLSRIENFYNIKDNLGELPPPMTHPQTGAPLKKNDLLPIFPELLIDQEFSLMSKGPIDEELRASFELFRPTPLIYARALKEYLDTAVEIFIKYEGFGPAGSHKINTALVQAFLAKKSGKEMIVT